MNENSQVGSCSRCGTALAPGALKGLCPHCLMALNLVAPTEIPGEVGPQGTKVTKPLPTPEEVAKHFPQLEILECLGRGGMGVVYKARQPKLHRVVALKILAPERVADPKFAERFAREAQALARLNHPNIVTVYDFGEADGLYYLTMEFVDGVGLRQMLQTRKMEPEQALAIVPKICEALQYAHDEGVVHRDIKPENILLDKKGRVKIADFGIAKIVGGEGRAVGPVPAEATEPEGSAQGTAHPATGLTQDQILGTPNYMAPEQVEHPQKVDHRADIYSLGVVFYEMLTGELPLGKFQPPSKKVQVDVRLDEVVLHTLEKEPERRYQQASQVKTAVETIAQTPAPPPGSISVDQSKVEAARRQVKGPGIGLFIVGCLNLGLVLALLAFNLFANLIVPADQRRFPFYSTLPVLLLAGYGMTLVGASRMRHLSSYGLAITATILAMILPPGCILGLPIGIWSLLVLTRREVREAFGKAAWMPPGTASVTGAASRAPSAARGMRAALACVAIAMTVIVLVAGVPAYFSVPIVALCLLAIVVLMIRTVAPGTEPVPGARMTADAWITVGIVLILGGGLLTAALSYRSSHRGPSQTAGHVPQVDAAFRPADAVARVGTQAAQEAVKWVSTNRQAERDIATYPSEAAIDLGNGITMEFLLIHPGSFVMGCQTGTGTNFASEKPAHEVTITRPFYLGKFEVTQEQWESVMGKNPSRFKGPILPVDNVSWDECQDFLFELQKKTRRRVVLPTEAQWEYACRAGTQTAYSFGDSKTDLADYAWFAPNSGGLTHPVGQKRPNPWGLHDMHGNVAEWCADWLDDYAAGPAIDPQGPVASIYHVVRGGCWENQPKGLRSSNRASDCQGHQRMGVRCALLVEEVDAKSNACPGFHASARIPGFAMTCQECHVPRVQNSMPETTEKQDAEVCSNFMKFVVLAARSWAANHDGVMPPTLSTMFTKLKSPNILVCPQVLFSPDYTNQLSWGHFNPPQNITYEIVSSGLRSDNLTAAYLRCPIHRKVARVDGSIISSSSSQFTPNPTEKIDLGGGLKMEFVLIRSGAFTMGTSLGLPTEFVDEKPAHRVRIGKSFYLGKYEVTQAQWEAVMGSNPSQFQGPTLPVENVSWGAAHRFLDKLKEKTGQTFALPSEPQWEYACRAGTITRYGFGDNDANLGDYAWFIGNSGGTTHPVGLKKPNRWGLHDMHGNVWEWCEDAYGPYEGNRTTPPQGPPAGDLHVIRGGAWAVPANGLRSSNRNSDWVGHQRVGFRCVMLLDGTASTPPSRRGEAPTASSTLDVPAGRR